MDEKPSKQTIIFSGSDPDPTFAVHSRDVEVESADGTSTNGISRIKANNIVDYSWEERFFSGQMLAVHRSTKYIAYGIKGRSMVQCTIRIVNRESGNRALMKDAQGLIEDLSFAQTLDVILLACVDNTGLLLVYHITEKHPDIISTTLILQVLPDESMKKSIPYRVFWCSYIPEEEYDDEEDDVSKLLAVTRYNKIELWNIGTISPTLQQTEGPVKSGDTKDGYLVIEAHDNLITEAVFSPDGTAIATASLDGTCKFYQVYMPTGKAESRCLHQWSPHQGRPVTTLFFLDDLRKYHPEVPFWKYAVTGTDNNSELCLWSCETWQRLQHIKFKKNGSVEKKFKVGIDISASVIVINDMANRILYILELNKDEIQNSIPYVATVTEIRLHFAILSFGIVDASIGPHHPNMSPALDQPTSRINGQNDHELGVMMRMYIIQPKSLQSCDIAYPTKRSNIPIPSPVPNEDYTNGDCAFDNGTSSTSTCGEEVKPDSTLDNGDEPSPDDEVVNCVPLTPPPPSLNLMTPDAFSTSNNSTTAVNLSIDLRSNRVDMDSATEVVIEASMVDSLPQIPVPLEPETVPSMLDQNTQIKSGGSSPSREVEEILGMKKVTMFSEEQEEKDSHIVERLPNSPPPKLQHSSSQTRGVTCEDKSVGPVLSVADVQDLKEDIKKLCRMLEKQSSKIQELEHQMNSARQAEKRDKNMELFTKVIFDRIQAHQEKTEKLHNITLEAMNSHREETVSHVCQLVENSFCTHLPPLIQSQLVNIVNPALKDLKDLMHQELTVKLTATDVLLKENISKMLKNKALIETLTTGMTGAWKESLSLVCRDLFTQVLLPRMEQTCSTMMSDMVDTFSQGTAQHVSEVESQIKRLTEHWHAQVSELNTQILQQANAQTIQIIEKSFGELEERLYKKLSKTLVKAVNSGVSSRVMTPAVGLNSQAEIMELVHQGQLSEAFQQALSAAELPLVLSLCEKVPTSQVFTARGCILPQPVLLSLIQQLSSDLSSYSETKHRYLEEAVMNLDRKNPVTREHLPKVVSSLSRQLVNFISSNPMSPFIKRIKMLQMATNSLLN